jgi:ferredoxin
MTANDAYEILTNNLGFPGSARLRTIFEEMLTPDQAQISAALPGTAEDVAKKTGFEVEMIKEELETLFIAGAIFPRGDYATREYWRFGRSIGQLHDSTQACKELDLVKDRKFFAAWHDFANNEWSPKMGKVYAETPEPWERIVPAWTSIKDIPDTLPCEDIREILKAQRRIAVVPCSCRLRTTSVDEHCDHTEEENVHHCYQFNRAADYAVARQCGKELTTDEAIELMYKVEEDGLLHIGANSTSLVNNHYACQCCRDCCIAATPLDIVGAPLDKRWQKSRFIAQVDEEACIGCQSCVDRCQFDAIEMVKPEPESGKRSKKLKAKIDPEACFGCGVCVLGCDKVDALSMKMVRPPDHIPVV